VNLFLIFYLLLLVYHLEIFLSLDIIVKLILFQQALDKGILINLKLHDFAIVIS